MNLTKLRLADLLETGPEGPLDARAVARLLRRAETVEDAQRMLTQREVGIYIPPRAVRKIRWLMLKCERGRFTPTDAARLIGDTVQDACKFY